MPTLQDILGEQARIKAELQRMEDDESVTEEEDGDLRDTLVARWEELDAKAKPLIERMEKVRGITRAADNPANREAGTDPGASSGSGYNPGGIVSRQTPDLVIRNNRDPYDGLEAVRYHKADADHLLLPRSEIRERAFDAIELEAKRNNLAHDFAEEATRKAAGNMGIQEHVLLTGSQEYQDAFRAYIENPQGEMQRAALSLTLANGGYLLPFVLDPTVILTNSGSANPWRRISNVKQTTSNTWNGVTSAGVTAAWLTEGTMVTDGSPTVGNVVVTPQKAAAWVFGSLN